MSRRHNKQRGPSFAAAETRHDRGHRAIRPNRPTGSKVSDSAPPAWGVTKKEWLLSASSLLLVFACLATWFQFDFSDVMGYHSMFARALLDGRLYVDITPDQVRLMDMIRFQGRHYLQWGPTPGLIHLIPAVFGLNLSDRVACLLAGWATSLLYLYTTLLLRHRYFPTLPKWVCLLSFWMFALGSTTALVVLRPTVYNETIALATLFVVCAFVAFLRFQEQPTVRWALLCGVALALASTTRITLLICSPVFLAGLAAVLVSRKQGLRPALLKLGVYVVPLLLGVGVQLGYNYERFGSPWAYFPRYELDTATFAPVFNIRRIPENFRHYLLAMPEFSRDFPWVSHRGWEPIRYVVRAEAMSSLFLATPVVLLGFGALKLFRRRADHPLDLKLVVAVAGGSGLLIFGSLLLFRSASRRYMHDFLPLLLVVAFVGVALLWRQGCNWNAWRVPALALLAYMTVFHAHLAFTHSFVSLPSDLNVVRAVADFSPWVRLVLPGPNLDREEAIARNDIGTMYLEQRRFRKALEEFQRADKLMPGSEIIQKNVRLAQRLVGRSDAR
jgi:hypothetical protein